MTTEPRSTSLPSRYPNKFPSTQLNSTHQQQDSINSTSWWRTASRSRRHSSYAPTYAFYATIHPIPARRPIHSDLRDPARSEIYSEERNVSAPAALCVSTIFCPIYVSLATRPSIRPSTITRDWRRPATSCSASPSIGWSPLM